MGRFNVVVVAVVFVDLEDAAEEKDEEYDEGNISITVVSGSNMNSQ